MSKGTPKIPFAEYGPFSRFRCIMSLNVTTVCDRSRSLGTGSAFFSRRASLCDRFLRFSFGAVGLIRTVDEGEEFVEEFPEARGEFDSLSFSFPAAKGLNVVDKVRVNFPRSDFLRGFFSLSPSELLLLFSFTNDASDSADIIPPFKGSITDVSLFDSVNGLVGSVFEFFRSIFGPVRLEFGLLSFDTEFFDNELADVDRVKTDFRCVRRFSLPILGESTFDIACHLFFSELSFNGSVNLTD
jgi:hypothetical protein